MNWDELFLRTALTLAATFAGALSAYHLQNRREKIKEEKKKISDLNIALFTLLRQMNALASVKKDLDKYRDDKSRFFKLPPLQTNSYSDIRFDFQSLAFMLVSDDPNILHHLLVEQERFQQAIDAIKIRSEYQVKTIQPLLEAGDIGNKQVTWAEAEAAIGKYKLEGLVRGTDQVYYHVDESFNSSKNMLASLHASAKKQFPGVKFLTADED
jgi:hypothetical protein